MTRLSSGDSASSEAWLSTEFAFRLWTRGAERCEIDPNSAEWRRVLNVAGSLRLSPPSGSATDEHVPLGSNVRAQREGCANYPGGLSGLAQELQTTMREGMSCLSRMGWRLGHEAQSLAAYFDAGASRPVTIDCRRGTPGDSEAALAYTFGDPNTRARAPGMRINGEQFSSMSLEERKQTLFHEMLHTIGFNHGEGMDVPYLASLCCTPTPQRASAGSGAVATEACALAQDDRAYDEWEGDYAQARYLRVGIRAGIPDIQLYNSVWNAAMLAPASARYGSGRTAGEILLAAAKAMRDEMGANPNLGLSAIALATAAVDRLPASPASIRKAAKKELESVVKALRDEDGAEVTEPSDSMRRRAAFARGYGQVLSTLFSGDRAAVTRAITNFRRDQRLTCEGRESHGDTMGFVGLGGRDLTSLTELGQITASRAREKLEMSSLNSRIEALFDVGDANRAERDRLRAELNARRQLVRVITEGCPSGSGS